MKLNNFNKFLIKAGLLLAVIFLSRAIFQFPVEYFGLHQFLQNSATRAFSKIDGLKVLVIISIFFGLYYKDIITKINHPKTEWKKSVLYLAGAEFFIMIYYLVRFLVNSHPSTNKYLVIASVIIILSASFMMFLLSVFSYPYLKLLWKRLKNPIIVSAVSAIVLYNLLMVFQKQWYFFSSTVAKILAWIFSLFYPTRLTLGGSPNLFISDFSVNIGAPCSGIDSMFLFFAFFAALYALDHKKIDKKIYFMFFLAGFVGVYLVNILRLFLLILTGIHISPEFALGLFHTNAGWLLFVIYFLGYYMLARKFIYTDKTQNL